MFKFDFDIDDIDEEFKIDGVTNGNGVFKDFKEAAAAVVEGGEEEEEKELEPFSELELRDLIDALPSQISFSSLDIPISSSSSSSSSSIRLSRRDLFDARFQLISESDSDGTWKTEADGGSVTAATLAAKNAAALQFIEAPSDLVPGVYEGGLKTWECSLDLVNYMEGLVRSRESGNYRAGMVKKLRGKKMLEIGCGTAFPSMYLLQRVLGEKKDDEKETAIHLQDYNASVLQLVTLPNLLLTWYTSPAAEEYRTTLPQESAEEEGANLSELEITPQLREAFVASLEKENVRLRFFAGSWETFDFGGVKEAAYDIVLTSETIYRTSSLPSLISLLERASGCEGSLEEVPKRRLEVKDRDNSGGDENYKYLCLVAAKVVYFGVGGGMAEFVEAASQRGAAVERVWSQSVGIGREIRDARWQCV